MVPGTILLPIGLLWTGWSAREGVHWIVPDIGIFVVGAGMILNFQTIQTYVIDAFTLHAASGASPLSPLVIPSRGDASTDMEGGDSAGGGDVLPVARGVRLPAVRAADVRRARVRAGRHHPRVRRDRDWGASVRLSFPPILLILILVLMLMGVWWHRPFLFWFYGERIRNASKYAKRT